MARKLPLLTPDNSSFWQGGQDNKLLIYQCSDCKYWLHPPGPLCKSCGSRQVAPQAVSGFGHVVTFTLNYQPWVKDLPVPYVIAIVELVEQPQLRMTTNIIDCEPEAVTIDMPVEVNFRQYEDVWIPMFRKTR